MRFGTDGVRGVANAALTPEYALALGRATARVFATQVVVGRDTRRSCDLLEAAFVAGVCAEGSDAVLLGVIPTPAVAMYSQRDACAGAVISASHNGFADNGIKIFAPGGLKLHDDTLVQLENAVAEVLAGVEPSTAPTGPAVGVVKLVSNAAEEFARHVGDAIQHRSQLGALPLTGRTVVLDCAHGASYQVAGEVFSALGAEVVLLSSAPNGTNINEGCGSTHPEALQAAVREHRAMMGLAFDGDADRVLAVDDHGELVDGDQLLALLAVDLQASGDLAQDTVVVTVMSNLGFLKAMEANNITVVVTPVGDRFVLEALAEGDFVLGGEQSGHIVIKPTSSTGDGVLAGAHVALLVAQAGQPLSQLAGSSMQRFPQILTNISVPQPMPDIAERIAAQIEHSESQLGGAGRVLVRPSGTEALVRVMVEAMDLALAEEVSARLADAVRVAVSSA